MAIRIFMITIFKILVMLINVKNYESHNPGFTKNTTIHSFFNSAYSFYFHKQIIMHFMNINNQAIFSVSDARF